MVATVDQKSIETPAKKYDFFKKMPPLKVNIQIFKLLYHKTIKFTNDLFNYYKVIFLTYKYCYGRIYKVKIYL